MSSLDDRISSPKELNNLVRILLEFAVSELEDKGINPLIVETYRSQKRQNYLYCQGRTIYEVTKKGISKSFAKKYCKPNGKKVTWTLDSIHKIRKAVDIVPQRKINGKWTAIWNNKDEQTQAIIKVMQKYGFEAGINWDANPDSPHFQINGPYSKVFSQGKSTVYVTRVIQKALNEKLRTKLVVDGDWGDRTTKAVIAFRKQQGYKIKSGIIGPVALKALLK